MCHDPDPCSADLLLLLAEMLESAQDGASPHPAPSLVRASGLGEGSAAKLAVRPLPGTHLGDALMGMVTPRRWQVAGVLATGDAHALDEEEGGDLSREVIGRARVVVLCDRYGATATVLRLGEAEPSSRISGPPPGDDGFIVDALRRSLGLATAPPAREVQSMLEEIWLHRLLSLALTGHRVDASLLDALRPRPVPSWDELRQQSSVGAWEELALPARAARWMDDGMFSRWCSGAFPERAQMLDHLSQLLAPRLFARLLTCLAAGHRRSSS